MGALWVLRRLAHWGVILTLSLVFGIYGATVWYVFWKEVFGEVGWGVKVVLFVELIMLLWSYFVSVYTVETRRTYNPGEDELAEHGVGDLRKMFGKGWKVTANDVLQYCKICSSYKEPRAHHCSQCGVCVSKMDHHCPWINNCVNARDHKSFTLFVFYVPVGCSHTAYLLFPFASRVFNGKLTMSVGHTIVGNWCFAMSVALVIAVTFLLKQQLDSLRHNMTQVEDYILTKAETRRSGPTDIYTPYPFNYPYDLGTWENVKSVFGGNPLLWWFPTVPGHRVYWPLNNPKATQFDLTMEQLSQKTEKNQSSKRFKAVRDFNGNCSSWCLCCCRNCITLGLRETAACPWPDEKRLTITQGDQLIVTRFRTHWLYGRRQETDDNYEPAGWFPRQCVESIPGSPYPELSKLAGVYILPTKEEVILEHTRVRFVNSKEAYSLSKYDGKARLLGLALQKVNKGTLEWENGDVWVRGKTD
eukprot:TRINITY_DN14008_c0_g1_i2.p1 TRINITY_DN14008_c0_g1~~TRINITY_DN14008_c0_g1_i2.p1  ORF type:complete len:492 (+),score=90.39 TRINITY_DN14008_c0_g1_i2:59-1477(+)